VICERHWPLVVLRLFLRIGRPVRSFCDRARGMSFQRLV
jgi:hypothetical protein